MSTVTNQYVSIVNTLPTYANLTIISSPDTTYANIVWCSNNYRTPSQAELDSAILGYNSGANLTLNPLTYSGNLSAATINATTISSTAFTGNGAGLTGILSNFGNANVSVYLLTNSGNINAGYYTGNGSQLSGILTPASTTHMLIGNQIYNANVGNVYIPGMAGGHQADRPITLIDSAATMKVVRPAGSGNPAYELQEWDATFNNLTGWFDMISINGILNFRNRQADDHTTTTVIMSDQGGNVTVYNNFNANNIVANGSVTGTRFIGTATNATNITTTISSANVSYPLMLSSSSTTGNQSPIIDVGIAWNPSTDVLTMTSSSSIITGNVTANYFTGNGSLLTGIVGYGNANVASYLPTYSGSLGGTLTSASQPNITTVGTLTSLGTSGSATIGGALAVTGGFTVNGNSPVFNTGNVNSISANTYANIGNVTLNSGNVYIATDKNLLLRSNNATWVPIGGGPISFQYGNVGVVSGTTIITSGSTLPTTSQGTLLWSANVTPVTTSSRFVIDFSPMVTCSANGKVVSLSVFRGTTCIYATGFVLASNNLPYNIPVHVVDKPNTTSNVQYSMYCGVNTASTWYVTGQPGQYTYGNAGPTTWSITEV